jgi:hypothetical protein
MYLNRKDLEKIQNVLEKFPEVDHFELHQEGGSGIGSVTKIVFHQMVNGYSGQFEVEISGVEDW